jgi:hypothetical protein
VVPIRRCPHCGSILGAHTMPQAIRQVASAGPTSMERIKKAAHTIEPRATNKQVYNAIALLIRTKRMKKIAHGWYQAL